MNSSRPYLQGVVCQSTCTQGYYVHNDSYTCQVCSKWCVVCSSSSNCTKCSGAYLYQGTCQSSCLSNYYPSLVFTCELCLSPCLECYDSANCKTCIAGYYLYLTHCLKKCPPDQWTMNMPNKCNTTCLSPYFKIPD